MQVTEKNVIKNYFKSLQITVIFLAFLPSDYDFLFGMYIFQTKKSLSEGFSMILRRKNVLEHQKWFLMISNQWSKADLKIKS